MTAVDIDGDTVADLTFQYNALGRRVKIGSETGVYSGQQLVARYDNTLKKLSQNRRN
jgi:hypothetical protein